MATHWKALTNPDYIGAYAFEAGEEKIGTISYVREEQVISPDGKKDDCIVAHFAEKNLKPLIMNATNCKAMTKLYKTPYIENWVGKKIVMHVQTVKAFGDFVDAVRIKPEIPKGSPSEPVCAECGQVVKPFGKMSATQLAEYTSGKYGAILCAECAKAYAEAPSPAEAEPEAAQ